MPLHLIKLSVATGSIADLQGWIDDKIKAQKKRGVKKPAPRSPKAPRYSLSKHRRTETC